MKTLCKTLLLLALAASCAAQEAAKKHDAPAKESAPAAQERARSSYHLDFRIYELEAGKRINERSFSLAATVPGGWSELRVGTRVPVTAKEGQSTYLDVGVNLTCRLTEEAGSLFANVRMEISSFAMPEQSTEPRGSAMPVLRNTRGEVETRLTPGKPQVIASVDDVNSKKRVQIEVTATKVE